MIWEALIWKRVAVDKKTIIIERPNDQLQHVVADQADSLRPTVKARTRTRTQTRTQNMQCGATDAQPDAEPTDATLHDAKPQMQDTQYRAICRVQFNQTTNQIIDCPAAAAAATIPSSYFVLAVSTDCSVSTVLSYCAGSIPLRDLLDNCSDRSVLGLMLF